MTPVVFEAEVRALAAQQYSVVSRKQLRRIGLSRSAIRHRVTSGRLFPVLEDVYSVHSGELTIEGKWMAAALDAGDGAGLSHLSGAALLGCWRPGEEDIEVSLPGRAGRECERSYILHRPEDLPPSALRSWRGIPVTIMERTLLDVAFTRDENTAIQVIGEASRRKRVNLHSLWRSLEAVLDENPVRPKHARLRNILNRHAPELHMTQSELERLFVALCTAYGITLPMKQHWIGRSRVDFIWTNLRLIAEVDGYETHGTIAATNADYARQRALTLKRYTVFRFNWSDIVHRPAKSAADLAQAIAQAA